MEKYRNGTIDFFKFIFTLFVIQAHLMGFLPKKLPFANGHFGVEFFFLCSGLFLASICCRQLSQENTISLSSKVYSYAKKRFIGLYPLYFVSLLMLISYNEIMNYKGITALGNHLLQSTSSFLMLSQQGLTDYYVIPFSWFVTALFVCSIVIYVLIMKFKDIWFYFVGPIVCLIGFGYLFQKRGSLFFIPSNGWMGVTNISNIRAISEIVLGTLCYKCSIKLSSNKDIISTFGKCFLTLMEIIGYAVPIYYLYIGLSPKLHLGCLLFISIAISISFSGSSYLGKVFDFPIFNILGKFSYAMYLTQWVPQKIFGTRFSEVDSLALFLAVYFCLDIIAATICYFIANNIIPKLFLFLKKLFIKSE